MLRDHKYLLLANGGILTAVKAGAIRTGEIRHVRLEFAEVPQDIAVPRRWAGVIKFEQEPHQAERTPCTICSWIQLEGVVT